MKCKTICISILILVFWALQTNLLASSPQRFTVSTESAPKMDSLCTAYYDLGLFNGAVLVAKDGKVVFRSAYGKANFEWNIPNTPDTKFNLASISKQFTAMAIMILAEEGKVRLDEPISQYLPGFRKELAERITISQLLSHTSGLPDEPLGPAERRRAFICDKKPLVDALNELECLYPPGSKFSYSNSGYNILALIIESVSGQEFPQFLQERIFTPLKMYNTAYRSHDVLHNRAYGYTKLRGQYYTEESISTILLMGAGGIYSSVNDLALWDRALAEHVLISEESTEQMFSAGLGNYGFGWELIPNYYVEGTPVRLAAHSGRGPGANTDIKRFLDDNLLIVCLSNMQEAQSGSLASLLGVILINGEVIKPLPTCDERLLEILFDEGVSAAKSFYRKAAGSGEYRMPGTGGLNRLAYQFLRMGLTQEALMIFRLYLDMAPHGSYAHDGYAEALFYAGLEDSSLIHYSRAIELNFDNIAARRMLKHFGVSECDQVFSPVLRKIIDEGINSSPPDYNSLLEISGATSETYINTVAYNLLRHGKVEEGGKLLEFNIHKFPGSANAWDSYAEYQLLSGDTLSAIEFYQKSLELNPENDNAKSKLEKIQK